MNLRGFEQDFTKDLESFVKRQAGWEPITPLKTWSAKKTAAPERHKVLGFENGLSPQTQIHLLDNQNNAFEIIESLLRIYLSPIEYNTSDPFAPIDVEAEQVWLFAMRWLEHYYECLMEPLAIRTEFYKQSHTKFLDLMRKMLAYNPKKRISFNDALKIWYPSSTVFSVHLSNEQDSLSTIDPTPLGVQETPLEGDMKAMSSAECHNPLPVAPSASSEPLGDTKVMNSAEYHSHVPAALLAPPVESSVSASNTVPPLPSEPSSALPAPSAPSVPSVSLQQPQARSRLALKQPDGCVGHNKTRRSPRNSGRSPAIGNRGTRVRG
jgi:serine/threonine protein kinase